MNRSTRPLPWSSRLALVALAVLAGGPASAAGPRDELLRFVPPDVAFCVLLQNLRQHGNDLAASPFVAKAAQSPLGRAAEGLAEVRQLLKFGGDVERFTGLSPQRLRDDVLGDLVVLAYQPGPPGKPEQEAGLVLVHARDAKALAALVQHVNDTQKKNGELKGLEERTHRGQRYVRREEKDTANYYHLRGRVLLFSSQEALLRRALEQDADLAVAAAGPVEASVRRLGVADALAAFWVNPRAFDAALADKLRQAGPDEAAGLKTLQVYWKALDALAFAVHLDAELAVSLAVSARPDDLPPAGRTFFARLAEPSRLWAALPDEPLFALAARLDLKALLLAWAEFLPQGQRDTVFADLQRYLGAPLGKKLIDEVLPAVGPDLSVVVLPPPREQKGFFPAVLLALRVAPSGESAPVGEALASGLNTLATLVVWGHNAKNPAKPLEARRVTLDKVHVHYLAGDAALPVGFRPAYALVRGHLVLASSPDAVRALSGLLSEDAAPAATTGPIPVLRVSVRAWRDYLRDRRADIVKHLVEVDGQQTDEVQARLDGLLAGLEYVDRLEVRHRPEPGRLLLQVSLRTRWPLK